MSWIWTGITLIKNLWAFVKYTYTSYNDARQVYEDNKDTVASSWNTTKAHLRRNAITYVILVPALIFIAFNRFPTECREITKIKSGKLRCSSKPYNTAVGTACEFQCKRGYRLDGSKRTVCSENGTWTSLPPTCHFIKCFFPECVRPPELGIYSCSEDLTCDDTGCWAGFEVACYYPCRDGYRHVGPKSKVCQEDGTWSVEEIKCEPITCKPPPIVELGDWMCTDPKNFDVSSQCAIQCMDGHVALEDVDVITCGLDGEWSPDGLGRCGCPVCKAGKRCEHTTSWAEIAMNIPSQDAKFSINYVGHDISCEREGRLAWAWDDRRKTGMVNVWIWRCACTDNTSEYSVEEYVASRYVSCVHSVYQFINKMILRKRYPEMCKIDFPTNPFATAALTSNAHPEKDMLRLLQRIRLHGLDRTNKLLQTTKRFTTSDSNNVP